jgi:UDP-N-acetylglucosamine--N-acetylmuramyl-(pentapeptide) pyrophosphoryl-undecaprenol N-acetylglucosamine transferase
MKTKKILLIGGGTGGHIFPLRNLIDELVKKGAEVELVVSDNTLDRKIVAENFTDLPVHFFQAGKIRRYLSWKNLTDPFLIMQSCWKALQLLKEITPDVIFFKGGFVGFPFLVAAKALFGFKGKIYSHESDISAGILTKLASQFSTQTFQSFGNNPMPLFYSPTIEKDRTPPLLSNSGDQSTNGNKILVFGGSQGAQFLNEMTMKCQDKLMKKYVMTLVAGVGKKTNICHDNFTEYEFIPTAKLAQKIHESDLIIARGGANSLFEIISTKVPSIIIPLPSVARNHQLLNAQYFSEKNLCVLLEEKNTTPETFVDTIERTMNDESLKKSLQKTTIENKANEIAQILTS